MSITDQLLALRRRPDQRVAMLQSWRDMLFLHRRVDQDALRKLLPKGLELDLWEGEAWIGLVPFRMEGIRPAKLRAVPWLSAFPETNVRTYVTRNGQPGVWFFSLDAARWAACAFARTFYSLPYHHAMMQATRVGDELRYASRRARDFRAMVQIEAQVAGDPAPAAPGTFEFWLVERYLLYAERRGKLFNGRVFHEPYSIAPARVSLCEQTLTDAWVPPGEWEHTCFSPGVDVEVFPIRNVEP
jgi:hypothetical protein